MCQKEYSANKRVQSHSVNVRRACSPKGFGLLMKNTLQNVVDLENIVDQGGDDTGENLEFPMRQNLFLSLIHI